MSDRAPRIGFVTGHVFGRRALEGIVASRAFLDGALDVPLVVTLPPERRTGVVGSSEVDGVVPGVRVTETTDGGLSSMLDSIDALDLDYLLVIGWSRLVRPEVLRRFPSRDRGVGEEVVVRAVGMHPTPLPVGRGQAPIPWTIIKGLRHSALTVFGLEAAPDAGAVVDRVAMDVRANETAASLFTRFEHAHFLAGSRLADRVATGRVLGVRQDDGAASVWPKRRPLDSELSSGLTIREADAQVRALTGPYPRAYVHVGGVRFTVEATALQGRTPSSDWQEVVHDFADGSLSLYGRPG